MIATVEDEFNIFLVKICQINVNVRIFEFQS